MILEHFWGQHNRDTCKYDIDKSNHYMIHRMYQSEAQKWFKNRGFRPRTNALKPFLKAKLSPKPLGLTV